MTGTPPPQTPEEPGSDPVARTDTASVAELEAALADARDSAARSRRFLADAAHQLRTPVAGIQAAAENLLLGADPHDRGRLLADVVRETSRAARLITSLLRIARLDEGQPLVPTRCNPMSLCAEEVDRAWSLSPHLDIVLKSEGLPGAQTELDGGALHEVLANLLDNARRYAEQTIEVLIRATRGGVEIRVADDGPGVPAGIEDQVFERFVSVGDRGGSGLGLAIARELVRRHSGDLRYAEGAFVLWVPVPQWFDEDPDPATP